jgi:hypothetical protein
MTEVAGLLIRLEATTALLRSEMKRAEQQVGTTARKIETDAARAESAIERMGSGLKAAMGGFVAGFAAVSLGGVIGGIVQANVEFQKLQASLTTVTGSAANAKTAFTMIEKFAADTPFDLNQVVGAFVKMTALGLKPSEEALRSYGNTASAMGKSLDQFVEAIADATQGGGFERLKEFGIVMQADGNKVQATFQGVTETIGKNATEIEGYLRKIGNTQFAGAMAREMETLGGKFSNFGDMVAHIQRQIGEGGFNTELIKLTENLTKVGAAGDSTATKIGKLLGYVVGGLDAAIKSTADEIDRIAAIYERVRAHASVGPAEGVTVPVVDNTPTGKLIRGANFLSGNIPAQPIDPNAATGGVFVTKKTGTSRNDLRFGAASEKTFDEIEKENENAAKKAETAAESARKKAETASAAAAKKTADVVADLQFEADQLGRTALQQEIYNKLKAAGTTENTTAGRQISETVTRLHNEKEAHDRLREGLEAEYAQYEEGRRILESVRTPAEAYDATVTHLRQMLNAGAIDQTTFNRAVGEATTAFKSAEASANKLTPQMKFLQDTGEQAFDRIGGAITDSFARGENAFENLRNTGLSVVSELMQAFMRLALINPIKNALFDTADATLTGFGKGLQGKLAYYTGASQTGAANFSHLNNGQARALGGPVAAGASYLVGENGPEIFTPSINGAIVPRAPTVPGRAAAPTVEAGPTVVQHLNFSLGVQSTVRAEINNLMPKIAAQSQAAIMNTQARRGRSL